MKDKKDYIHLYKVAGHYFQVQLAAYPYLNERMQQSYAPFEMANGDEKALFCAEMLGELPADERVTCIFEERRSSSVSGCLQVFTTAQGWLFQQTLPFSEQVNARIRLSADFRRAQIALYGSEAQGWFAFNSALMLCYLLATAQLDTILTHASCVVNGGKAYLFLGKSGTGKSTHSALWLQHIAGTWLLNDDHPILRVNAQGEVIAYGSPWSGKTPCYRNESAPVGGIIRIRRAKQNSIQALAAVQAYASLTTSFSGMTWHKGMADARHRTLTRIIGQVPCYVLSCLPDAGAAAVCAAAVRAAKPLNAIE